MTDYRPYRLYRDPESGYLAGVCAGLARYLGAPPVLVRLGWFFGLLFLTPPFLIGYLILWAVLPRQPGALFASREEESLRRSIHLGPGRTLHDLRMKFREMEQRLAGLEAAVVSKEYTLRKEFRDIDR